MSVTETAIAQKTVALAKAAGHDPARMSRRQYMMFRFKAMTTLQQVEAIGKVAASHARTKLLDKLFDRVVPDEKVAANVETCESCPDKLFKRLADQAPACDGCGCSGGDLESKWKDSVGECPKGHWTNITVEGEDAASA